MEEVQKVLDELEQVRPEKLTGEAKRLFEAIMKIADERDKLLKERQADKEKIKELEKDYAEMLIKLNVQNLNNSIEQRKESNEQLEALHEGWKIELEKKDNRIKELESDKEIKDKMIEMYIEHIYRSCDFDNRIKTKEQIKQYFENLAKESGEIDENKSN